MFVYDIRELQDNTNRVQNNIIYINENPNDLENDTRYVKSSFDNVYKYLYRLMLGDQNMWNVYFTNIYGESSFIEIIEL